jgi:hypothetical protein
MSKVLPFKSRGLRNELRMAMEQRAPVRLEREPIQYGTLHGYVIGLSRDFCLVAEIGDAMRLDGYLVVAIADLTRLEIDPAREFVDKALTLRGETLRIPDGFCLDDWAAIARSASASAPLLSINMVEDEEGEVSYVGQYAGLEQNLLILREMDPNAHWYPDAGGYELEAIGSIGFGNGYLDALWQVAGPPGDLDSESEPASDTIH